MHISNVYINNYKSLKSVSFDLKKGKNVIVGKNNSGKSNIITALDILFGSKNPTYREHNINDFYTYNSVNADTGEINENISEYYYIQAELIGKDFNVSELDKIKKSTSFSKIKDPQSIINKNSGYVDYDFFANLDDLAESDKIDIVPNTSYKIKWFKKDELISLLSTSKRIIVFYCKERESENSGFGIIVIDSNNDCWISHFLRNELKNSIITTAIIPAFRNPKDELRLVNYSWYGKLIKALWDKGKDGVEEKIEEKSNQIKELADKVFNNSTTELRELLRKAISHKSVSFKLLPNQKNDIYKNVKIYVDDGIDRPLDNKGSGIQSAIIISLFTTYCRTFHNSSSLLVTEEPELFLHPQARRVVSAELENYLGDKETNQLIVSTHSTEFVKNVPVHNIIIATKASTTNETLTTQISYDDSLTKEDVNKIIRFIWSKNTEIFFSDKVLLVEGGEEFLLPSVFYKIENKKQILDYNNVSIARVDGKGNFLTYAKILDKFNIPWVILGDLDCYDDVLRDLMIYNELNVDLLDTLKASISKEVSFKKLKKEVVKNSSSKDGYNLAELFNRIKLGEIKLDDSELISFIQYLETRFAKSNFFDEITNNKELKKQFQDIQSELQKNNIFILEKGAIEAYYTTKAKQLEAKGKDNRALEIASRLYLEESELSDYINETSIFKSIYNKLLEESENYIIEENKTE